MRFKRLVAAIVDPKLAKIAKVRRDAANWQLQRFRGFLKDFKRAYVTNIKGRQAGDGPQDRQRVHQRRSYR